MSIVDDLVENLVERNALRLNGNLRITLIAGGLKINGTVVSTLRDQNKNRDVLKATAPIDASIQVGELVIPVPRIP